MVKIRAHYTGRKIPDDANSEEEFDIDLILVPLVTAIGAVLRFDTSAWQVESREFCVDDGKVTEIHLHCGDVFKAGDTVYTPPLDS